MKVSGPTRVQNLMIRRLEWAVEKHGDFQFIESPVRSQRPDEFRQIVIVGPFAEHRVLLAKYHDIADAILGQIQRCSGLGSGQDAVDAWRFAQYFDQPVQLALILHPACVYIVTKDVTNPQSTKKDAYFEVDGGKRPKRGVVDDVGIGYRQYNSSVDRGFAENRLQEDNARPVVVANLDQRNGTHASWVLATQ